MVIMVRIMAWLNLMGSPYVEELRPTFEEALRDLDGSWTVEITRGLVGAWWLVVFRRDDGFERTLLLSPLEQTPTLLRRESRTRSAGFPHASDCVPTDSRRG